MSILKNCQYHILFMIKGLISIHSTKHRLMLKKYFTFKLNIQLLIILSDLLVIFKLQSTILEPFTVHVYLLLFYDFFGVHMYLLICFFFKIFCHCQINFAVLKSLPHIWEIFTNKLQIGLLYFFFNTLQVCYDVQQFYTNALIL